MAVSVETRWFLGAVLLIGAAPSALAPSALAEDAAGPLPVIAPAAHHEVRGAGTTTAAPFASGQLSGDDYALDASEIYDIDEMPPDRGLAYLRSQFASSGRREGTGVD